MKNNKQIIKKVQCINVCEMDLSVQIIVTYRYK